jgi:hypothetical protein
VLPSDLDAHLIAVGADEALLFAVVTTKLYQEVSKCVVACRLKVILMHLLRFDHVLFNHFRIVSDQLK